MANAAWVRIALPMVFVPLSLGLHHFSNVAPQWVFLSGLIAIGALADWVRRGTEEVAGHLGGVIGSLLNVSFGNAAELVLALFVLANAQTRVVQAQITGSIIGTTLLFFGLSALVGGLRREHQSLGRQAHLLSTLLLLVAVVLLLPAAFEMTQRQSATPADLSQLDEELSFCVSVVLLLLYAAHLVYVLVTHRAIFATRETGDRRPDWSLPQGLAVMAVGVFVIAFESELVSARLEETASNLGLTPTFIGVVVLALIGTIADLFAAAGFRAREQDGYRFRALRRLGDPDHSGGRARAGAGLLGHREPNEFGVRQPARPVFDRQRGVHCAGHRLRRRNQLVRGITARRGLCDDRAGLFLSNLGAALF